MDQPVEVGGDAVQALQPGRAHEAVEDEGIELAAGVAKGRDEGKARSSLDRLVSLAGFRGDAGDECNGLEERVDDGSRDRIPGRLELGSRKQLAIADDGVNAGDHAVFEQSGVRAIRALGEHQLLLGGEVLLHVAGRGRNREQQQAPYAETMGRSLVFRCAHEPDGDAGLLIDERRIRANSVRAVPGVAAAVELVEIPGRDSGALEAVALRQRSRGVLRHACDARPGHRLEAGLQRAQHLAAGDTVRSVIHHGKSHAQVRGNPVEVEVGDGNGRVGFRGDLAREERDERSFWVTCLCEESARPVRRRHDMAPDALRQGSDQRGHQLVAQARHLPVEPVGLQPRQ